MQLLETTIVHRILETLNWTRHNPHEEGNTTEPGSPRTAETAQLNGTAGGHRPTAKKNAMGAAVEGSEQFCEPGWCRVGRDTPPPSRAPSVAECGFLVDPTRVIKPLHLHLMFGGGLVRLFLPNHGFRRPNVHRTAVKLHAGQLELLPIPGPEPPPPAHWLSRGACTGWPFMRAGRAHGTSVCACRPHTAQVSVHTGRTRHKRLCMPCAAGIGFQ